MDRFKDLRFFFTVAFIGFFVIARGLPESVACSLRDYRWFVLLWPVNEINEAVLSKATGSSLDVCRVVPATAWSAGIGILMLITRFIFEIKFNERRNLTGVSPAILFYGIALFVFTPQNPLGPTIINNGFSSFSINVHNISMISEIELLLFSFISFLLFSEGVACTLILIRSKADKWSAR